MRKEQDKALLAQIEQTKTENAKEIQEKSNQIVKLQADLEEQRARAAEDLEKLRM